MDVIHTPDNHIPSWGTLRSHTARPRAVLSVRAQLQSLLQGQQDEQQQQEQQQEQVLPLQHSLEVGQS